MPQPVHSLTVADVARRLGVSIGVVRKLTDDGHLHCLRLPSKHRRYSEADVTRFLAENTDREKAS